MAGFAGLPVAALTDFALQAIPDGSATPGLDGVLSDRDIRQLTDLVRRLIR